MDSEKEFLSSYKQDDYERPSVTSDVAAFRIGSVENESYRRDPENALMLLLIKRGGHPYKDMWALPGGFLQKGETIEECALRETQEETSVQPAAIMPVGVFSAPDRDPRGWIISCAYVSVICDEKIDQKAADDASDAQWFKVGFSKNDEEEYILTLTHEDVTLKAVLSADKSFGCNKYRIIESGGLAFDHASIIASALTALRAEAKHYEAIFDFMPEKFTLSYFQSVYETIMDVSVLPPNFRRMVGDKVIETEEFVRGGGHRPAKLYKRR
ncbi:MAG: NUDIX hydrolase [Ruminococcus sp.]|nr:NUDIX hydrolase [Ruminococcus sp.]